MNFRLFLYIKNDSSYFVGLENFEISFSMPLRISILSEWLDTVRFCWIGGLRSHYLLCIRQTLYQLSYNPKLRTGWDSNPRWNILHWVNSPDFSAAKATCPFAGEEGHDPPTSTLTEFCSTNWATLPFELPERFELSFSISVTIKCLEGILDYGSIFVTKERLELSRLSRHQILSLACLPIPPFSRTENRIWTYKGSTLFTNLLLSHRCYYRSVYISPSQFLWPWSGSNRHGHYCPRDFKSRACYQFRHRAIL